MLILVALTVGLTGTVPQAQAPSPSPLLIRVFVATKDSGEQRELADRRASVKDLSEALASKKKSLVIVETEDQADVVVEVVQRTFDTPRVVLGIGTRPGEPPGGLAPVRTGKLLTTLVFGQMAIDMQNKNKTNDNPRGWKSAAEDVAGQIDKWINQFRNEIIKAR